MNKPKRRSNNHKNTKTKETTDQQRAVRPKQAPDPRHPNPLTTPISGREHVNPITYDHPYDSMARFADLLALRYDANRTRYAYYRCLRLVQEHFECDPAAISETQLRDYFLFVKFQKKWMPKTIRQTVATTKLFFVDHLGHNNWQVFSQVRTKDHDTLPSVLTREEVIKIIRCIRLRRYRTPIKLIYCCGLRLGECLSLTKNDIKGAENKLIIRGGKGNRDRMVPLPTAMYWELRAYWDVHKHPFLIFPNVGRGENTLKAVAERMHRAKTAMPYSSLQRLMILARKELNIPEGSIHTLRHAFATHLLEAGANPHTVQKLLGHKNIETTMVYMHMTHQSTQDALSLMDSLVKGLPR